MFGIRALIAGEALAEAHVDAVVDQNAGFSPPALADIDAQMAIEPARLSPRGFGLTFGIKIR